MKTILSLLPLCHVFVASSCLAAQAHLQVAVVDDLSQPVQGATVHASTFGHWKPGPDFGTDMMMEEQAVTDSNGVARLSIRCKSGRVTVTIHGERDPGSTDAMVIGPARYYLGGRTDLYFSRSNMLGSWSPNPACTTTHLRRVINPISMYAASFLEGQLPIPATNRTLGFDLVDGDWTAPYGEGRVSDFLFNFDCRLIGSHGKHGQYYEARLDLRFSNPSDGIVKVLREPLASGSLLVLPHQAPATGYSNAWTQSSMYTTNVAHDEYAETDAYYFRVRGTDPTNALYGKIYGPMYFTVRAARSCLVMTYYLNPTPGDRNVEFDPKHNLATNLPALRRAGMP